jgi:thiosulfate reductase/polysulfide reductase chain A
MPENRLWLHPDPAAKLGIEQEEYVWVSSPVGRERIRVRLTEETRVDTVYMDTGFGVISRGLSKIFGKGACIADVLEDEADTVSGNMAMHETMVTVSRFI